MVNAHVSKLTKAKFCRRNGMLGMDKLNIFHRIINSTAQGSVLEAAMRLPEPYRKGEKIELWQHQTVLVLASWQKL
jgi:hypothetical protein